MTTLLQDLRFAGRLQVRSPGFSLPVLLTLALGIGANLAIFTIVDAVVLSPACSSFDMFRDYAHRAEVFCAAARRLTGAPAREGA